MSSKTFGELMNEKGTLIDCWNCEYQWNYTGNMKRATCPSCSRKNNVEERKVNSDSCN